MPIANVVLPDGTKVTIEGKSQEISAIIKKISQPANQDSIGNATRPKSSAGTKVKTQPRGPTGLILALREEGYFKARRTLVDIQQRLEERGHIYAQTSLSPVLVRLARRRELRRIKTVKGWVYVA